MISINKTKKRTIGIFVGFAFTIFLFVSGCQFEVDMAITPKEEPAVTIHVMNPGNDNDISAYLQAAYDTAENGNVLLLPEGRFQFTGTLNFTKPVSLKGAGKNKTTLYRPESMTDEQLFNNHFIYYSYAVNDTTPKIVISDFTMKSKVPAGLDGLNGSLAKDYGVKLNCIHDFVITRCRFENFGYAALQIRHRDALARGLIYNNEFYHNSKGNGLGLGYGISVYGENQQWIDSPQFGSSNFIFIEDNTFEYHRHSVAGGGNALYVARYNEIKNNLILTALDMHGSAGTALGHPNHFAARATELYNNNIVNTKWEDGVTSIIPGDSLHVYQMTDHAIQPAGGESLIYDNYITGYTNGIRVIASSVCPEGRPLIDYQIGYDSRILYGDEHTGTDPEHAKGDCFVWNNTFTRVRRNNPENIDFEVYETACDLLREHRDYHLIPKPGYMPYTYPHPLRDEN